MRLAAVCALVLALSCSDKKSGDDSPQGDDPATASKPKAATTAGGAATDTGKATPKAKVEPPPPPQKPLAKYCTKLVDDAHINELLGAELQLSGDVAAQPAAKVARCEYKPEGGEFSATATVDCSGDAAAKFKQARAPAKGNKYFKAVKAGDAGFVTGNRGTFAVTFHTATCFGAVHATSVDLDPAVQFGKIVATKVAGGHTPGW